MANITVMGHFFVHKVKEIKFKQKGIIIPFYTESWPFLDTGLKQFTKMAYKKQIQKNTKTGPNFC